MIRFGAIKVHHFRTFTPQADRQEVSLDLVFNGADLKKHASLLGKDPVLNKTNNILALRYSDNKSWKAPVFDALAFHTERNIETELQALRDTKKTLLDTVLAAGDALTSRKKAPKTRILAAMPERFLLSEQTKPDILSAAGQKRFSKLMTSLRQVITEDWLQFFKKAYTDARS